MIKTVYKLTETFKAFALLETQIQVSTASLDFEIFGSASPIEFANTECSRDLKKQIKAFCKEHKCSVLSIDEALGEIKAEYDAGGVLATGANLELNVTVSFIPVPEPKTSTAKKLGGPSDLRVSKSSKSPKRTRP